MEKFRINLFIFLFITTISAILLSSCGESTTQPPVSNNDDSCGTVGLGARIWSGPLFGGYLLSTYTLGSERYYNFFFRVDSICTDNHVSGDFEALAVNVPGRLMRFDAAIEWQVFWERRDTGTTTLNNGNRRWVASITDLGLKVPFGESAANVYMNIYVHFPTVGTAEQDSAFLAQNLISIGMQINYKYHKPLADDNLITPANYHEMKLFYENDEKYLLDKKMKGWVSPPKISYLK